MIRIDLHNYEAFFLDYIEGNLSKAEINLLLDFISDKEDLKLELEEMMGEPLPELILVESQTDFSSLKVDASKFGISEENLEDEIIAFTEGELTSTQANQLIELSKESELVKKEIEVYQKLRFEPDTSILHKNKSGLKKSIVIQLFKSNVVRVVSVAAAILVFLLFNLPTEQNGNQLAEVKKVEQPEEGSSDSKTSEDSEVEESKPEGEDVEKVQEKKPEPNKVQDVIKEPVKKSIPSERIYMEGIANVSPTISTYQLSNSIYSTRQIVNQFAYYDSEIEAELNKPVHKQNELPENRLFALLDKVEKGLNNSNKLFNTNFKFKVNREAKDNTEYLALSIGGIEINRVKNN